MPPIIPPNEQGGLNDAALRRGAANPNLTRHTLRRWSANVSGLRSSPMVSASRNTCRAAWR